MISEQVVEKRDLYNIAGFSIYIIFFAIIIPLAMLFGLRAAESSANFDRYTFYAVLLVMLFLVVILDKLVLKKIKGFDISYLHDTHKGFFDPLSWVRNPWRLTVLSLVVFFPITFIGFLSKKAFVGFTAYQINPISEVYLTAEPTVIAETLIVAVLFGSLRWVSKYLAKDNKVIYGVFIFLSIGITTFLMYIYHTFVYAGSEAALLSVIFFFGVSTIVLYIVGSIIPLMVWHILNNALLRARESYSADLVIVVTVIIYIVLLLIFGVLAVSQRSSKKAGY